MTLSSRSPKLPCRSFRGQNLSNANFSGMDLSRIDFTDAILDGANLSHADVRGAIFRRSSLIGADLQFIRAGIAGNRLAILHAIILFLTLLLGILAGFIGSSTTGLLLDQSKIFAIYQHVDFWISWHSVGGLLAISCIILYGGILWWKYPLIAMILVSSGFIFLGTIVAGVIINACIQSNCDWEFVGQMMIAIEGAAAMPIFQTIFATLTLAIFIEILQKSRSILIAGGIGIGIAVISIIQASSSLFVCLGSVTIALSIIYLGWAISRRVRSELIDYAVLRRISTYLRTYLGTCFDRANLTDANLQYARLANTNFQDAKLTGTNIYGVNDLPTAKLDRTILNHPLVRKLLTDLQGANSNYTGCNFQGAYLVSANLTNANLTGANLDLAELQYARLDGANLTRIRGWGANFRGASLTGACIADWSIDRETQFAEINCDYIYLKAIGVERNPASGKFKPGDFTKLYQEIWQTVDLIFDGGIDRSVFDRIWQQLQIENAGIPLTIHSIERKGEGMIVVKVEVPPELDRTEFHHNFDRGYQLLLAETQARYCAELAGRDRELAIYRQHQERLEDLLQSLVKPAVIITNAEQLVKLKFGDRDESGRIFVSIEIGDRGSLPRAATIGKLDDANRVINAYSSWRSAYDRFLDRGWRIEIPDEQTNHLSIPTFDDFQTCQTAAHQLQQQLNIWCEGSLFQPIKELILQELQPTQNIQIVLQTDEPQLRQLPWQLWDLWTRFPHAEVTIASNTYRTHRRKIETNGKQKILAILGSSPDINLDRDRELLTQLSHIDVELTVEPTRQLLNQKLWEQDWDIVFFAGHSGSPADRSSSYIKINKSDRLTIAELKYALQQSLDRGLKLVILNSCDGLGLATELLSMQIPQVIVMRAPIPDPIAHEFLQSLTIALDRDLPLYLAIKAAREQLQAWEDRYPQATWLPVLCQNPADLGCRQNRNMIQPKA